MNLLNCYTIKNGAIERGISASEFDSIVAENDKVNYASVTMIPVLPNPGGLNIQSASLSVSFLHGYEKARKTALDGILLAYNPKEWRLMSDATHLVLLDPAGVQGSILVFIAADSGPVLSSLTDKTKTLVVDAKATPAISSSQRAALLLQALT